MGLLKEAVIKPKVKTEKIDRASSYILEIITSSPENVAKHNFQLGARSDGYTSQEFLDRVSEESLRVLAGHGIHGWSVDMAASQEASLVTIGYGNPPVLNWNDLHLVFVPRLAEVAQLPGRTQSEPLAA